MFHKIKKANGVVKVGDFIDVHPDQKDDLVKRGLIESEGHEENPDAPKVAKEHTEAHVTTTSDIINPKEKEKKAK